MTSFTKIFVCKNACKSLLLKTLRVSVQTLVRLKRGDSINLYGEWGIGKTRLLEDIKYAEIEDTCVILVGFQKRYNQFCKDIFLKNGRFGPYLQYEKEIEANTEIKKKKEIKKILNNNVKNVSIPKGLNIDDVNLEKANFLCSLPRTLGQNPETGKDIILNVGRFGPYLKSENTSHR